MTTSNAKETCPAKGRNDDFVDLTCILVKGHYPTDQHVDPDYGYWYGEDVTDYSLRGN